MRYAMRVGLSALVLAAQAGAAHAVDETPDYLVNLNLDAGLLATVQEALPERSAVDQSFLNSAFDPTLSLSADSRLSVTFVDEGAGYRNSLGYFAFDQGAFDGLSFGAIDTNGSGRISTSELDALTGVDVGMIFPNASRLGGGGRLRAGDTVVLGGGSISDTGEGYLMEGGRLFEAGTNVGFFVAANAWTGRNVQGWDGAWGDPNTYYSTDFLNPENVASATLDTAIDASRHTAMMFASVAQDEVIMGFEDLNRLGPSDEDFNDAVFIVRADPAEAISETDIQVYAAPAPTMGGGLFGLAFAGAVFGVGYRNRRTGK